MFPGGFEGYLCSPGVGGGISWSETYSRLFSYVNLNFPREEGLDPLYPPPLDPRMLSTLLRNVNESFRETLVFYSAGDVFRCPGGQYRC